jgi:hypothetical protein
VRVNDEMMSQREAVRMHYQVGENATWYLAHGIVRTRSSLVREYQENGGLRMDFTPERAAEEDLQLETNLMLSSVPIVGPAGNETRLQITAASPTLGVEDAVLASPEEHRRLAEGGSRLPPRLQDHRMSATLLRLAGLFNDLGVHCQVSNHLGDAVRTVELEFSLFVDTPESPTSIGGWQSDDGRVHLSLGFPNARR